MNKTYLEAYKPMKNKLVLLGICGSVAAYKGVDLASKMVQQGADVQVLMTKAATSMVGTKSLEAITKKSPIVDFFSTSLQNQHVELSEKADVLVVAPATSNTIAKLAYQFCDNPITLVAAGTKAPLVVAPAMEDTMFSSKANLSNLETIKKSGGLVVGPEYGRLASGRHGLGRMSEVSDICAYVRVALGVNGDLSKKTIVVSAGGTREALDEVRFLTNRSSGKMGYALAEAARDRGAKVVLVSASDMPNIAGVEKFYTRTAKEMQSVVNKVCKNADALIMAAAVADFRPETDLNPKLNQKISRNGAPISIKLIPNEDIIAGVKVEGLVKVAFAAQLNDDVEIAKQKMQNKGADFIVSNDILAEGSGFGSDTNEVSVIKRDGSVTKYPLMDKLGVAHKVLDNLSSIL